MGKRPDGSFYGKGGTDYSILQIPRNMCLSAMTSLIAKIMSFGNIDDKGEWTGMMGMLKKNETDIAIGWVANTYLRNTIADFSFPHIITANVFVTASPQVLQREYPFIIPFQFPVQTIYFFPLLRRLRAVQELESPRLHVLLVPLQADSGAQLLSDLLAGLMIPSKGDSP
ncbi:glutamate receptor ionotropic, delta-1 [Caerostris extrusa]|uniref:Glutamate receptor ionotropic, delta-1 n=1 Tax=Caerostris extrusa TaxID=172846 RepID=A0AAV4TQK3_CAEEX|nr:glutamate receptor ionotropic, delta-1 [Caerostris extrusa]